MIELLMVIAITSILGAVAIPQFLDYRNEARIAAFQQTLYSMRVGIKNQINQIRLKCPSTTTVGLPASLHLAWQYNDITSGNPAPCTSAEIPDQRDRKFVDIPYRWRPHTNYESAEPVDNPQGVGFPDNPFFTPTDANPISNYFAQQFEITSAGGQCAFVNTLPIGRYEWIYVMQTAHVFPGTNTAGISECSF